MGGKVLEYEAKTILNRGEAKGKAEGRAEGRAEGKAEGKAEEQTIVFLKMIDRGFSRADAQDISDLNDAQVADLLKSSPKEYKESQET